MTDKEVYGLIFSPASQRRISGRNSPVAASEWMSSGKISARSRFGDRGQYAGWGTIHTIRIPLTLTIVDGMKFQCGPDEFYRPDRFRTFRVKPDVKDIFTDPEGYEMNHAAGQCLLPCPAQPVLHIDDAVTNLADGMIMHIASEEREFCIFFDHLDGEYQVGRQKLPNFLKHCSSRLDGIGGCAILGDGSINLIIDVNGL